MAIIKWCHASLKLRAMPRLTIALDERDHLALRLVSIRESKRISEVIDDAIKHYLSAAGGYGLSITDASEAPSTQENPHGAN